MEKYKNIANKKEPVSGSFLFDSVAVAFVVTVAMAAAAVIAAGMFAAVVIAGGRLNTDQRAVQQLGHALIGAAGAAGIKLDAGLCQSDLCAGADAAADQAVYVVLHQKTGQRTVSASIGRTDFRVYHGTVCNFVDLELFGVTEMTVNIAVFVCNCDFHGDGFHSFLSGNAFLPSGQGGFMLSAGWRPTDRTGLDSPWPRWRPCLAS